MIISISGTAGSGKSTIAKAIAEKLQLEHYYIGGIRRKLAQEKGMSLEEYNILGETDPSTDIEVDNYQKQLGKKRDNFLIEGRTSFFFIPHSIKLYIKVDLHEAAKRILKDLQKDNNRNETKAIPKTVKEMETSITKRLESDTFRYKKYYDLDISDEKYYDFVLDTTNLTQEEAIEKTIQYIKLVASKE